MQGIDLGCDGLQRVCLSLMAGMRGAPGMAEEGEKATPFHWAPPGSQNRGGGVLSDNQRTGRLAPRSFAVGGRFRRLPILTFCVRACPDLKK